MPKDTTRAKARRTSKTKEPKKERTNYRFSPPMPTTDIFHVMMLLLTLPMKWFERQQRWVANYVVLAAHVGHRWTERTLRKVPAKFKELMAADGVKKEPGKRQVDVWNTVEALTLRVYALRPPMVTGESCRSVYERMLADGKDYVSFSTFKKKFKEVKECLGQIPTCHYRVPSPELIRQVCERILGTTVILRLSAYALTLPEVVAATLELHRLRPLVTIRVMYDKRWSSSSIACLEAIIAFYEAGIEVKHLKSCSMLIKAVSVDGEYCWSGSGNFATTWNAELNTEVEGRQAVSEADGLLDALYFGEFVERDGLKAKEAVLVDAIEAEKMRSQIKKLKEKMIEKLNAKEKANRGDRCADKTHEKPSHGVH